MPYAKLSLVVDGTGQFCPCSCPDILQVTICVCWFARVMIDERICLDFNQQAGQNKKEVMKRCVVYWYSME